MSIACRIVVDGASEGATHSFVAVPRVGEKVEIAGETMTVQSVTHVAGGASEADVHIGVSTKTLGH